MGLSKFTPSWRKASAVAVAPAPVGDAAAKDAAPTDKPADVEASAAAKPAESVADPVPAAGEAGAASARGGSRLVEGEKPRAPGPRPTERAKALLNTAVATAKPYRKQMSAAAALALATGLGFAGGTLATGRAEAQRDASVAASLAETTSDLRRKEEQIGRLAAEMKSVRAGLEAVKNERDRRGEGVAKQAQLIEKAERANGENATRIARLTETVERLEKTQREAPRPQALVERLERLEKSASITPSASISPAAAPAPAPAPGPSASVAPASVPTPPVKPDVTQTGSLPDAKVTKAEPAKADGEARRTPLEGFVVRDVDDGYALIETKAGRFIEVAVGQTLPGVGKVESVERRGRQWVVVTPRGFIGERWH